MSDRPSTSAASIPPKPKELESATSTRDGVGSRTSSSAHAGSGLEARRGRGHPTVPGEHRDARPDGARRTQGVADPALERGHRRRRGAGAERVLERAGLHDVVERGAGSVGVHPRERRGGRSGVGHGAAKDVPRAGARGLRVRDVVRGGPRGRAEQLRPRARTACVGARAPLEHEERGALAEQEPATLGVERAAARAPTRRGPREGHESAPSAIAASTSPSRPRARDEHRGAPAHAPPTSARGEREDAAREVLGHARDRGRACGQGVLAVRDVGRVREGDEAALGLEHAARGGADDEPDAARAR